jgi:hypothetical protein
VIDHVHTRFDATGRINDPHLHWGVRAAVEALLAQFQPPAPEELVA